MKNKIAIFLMSAGLLAAPLWGAQKFYNDDPITKEVDSQNAANVQAWDIDLVYDLAENLFSKPGDKTPNVRAQSVNTIDEVPDSAWYTNRTGLTPELVAQGPNRTNGPAEGEWTIISGKNDGVTPGFTMKDTQGKIWFIKPDPPGYPAMATGTEVAVTKLFWALGYYEPETHIATLKRENILIDPKATIKTPSGKRRKMKVGDINTMLRRAERNDDGTYRVIASLALPGKPLGGFRFYNTRPDDPNDVIPHEHRRELRGYFVFAAWLNHVDCKAINSMDTLITEDGRSYVRHNLLDFSSALGSGSTHEHEYWEGYEQIMEKHSHIGKDIISAGFLVEPYRTDPFFKSRAIGGMRANNQNWDPETWLPRATNAAFVRARMDDKFWAARKLQGISDDMIRAAIKTGQFNDQASEDFLVKALIERRDAIIRTYLTGVNPIVDPALDMSGVLTFHNAAVDAQVATAPQFYEVHWYRFDNATSQSTSLGGNSGSGTSIHAPAALPADDGAFLRVEISAKAAEHPSWAVPVQAYFKRAEGGWKLIGFERLQ
jgi:hypothetical protein